MIKFSFKNYPFYSSPKSLSEHLCFYIYFALLYSGEICVSLKWHHDMLYVSLFCKTLLLPLVKEVSNKDWGAAPNDANKEHPVVDLSLFDLYQLRCSHDKTATDSMAISW